MAGFDKLLSGFSSSAQFSTSVQSPAFVAWSSPSKDSDNAGKQSMKPSRQGKANAPKKYDVNTAHAKGAKKYKRTNRNSEKAIIITEKADVTKAMPLGEKSQPMAWSTRAAALPGGASRNRWTTCTEYSTASPVLITQDIAVKPLSLMSINAQKPTTTTKETPETRAIKKDATKHPQNLCKLVPRLLLESSTQRKTMDMMKPTAIERPPISDITSTIVRYCSQKS
mmetsp:Transcript_39868/g.74668  ORF Transcript_39868/g.74668 Transcript_39868/m.74668 type:complete len:225 (-) Transcript_39868:1882-2556(-)